jgi:DNA adenine methylase
MLTMFPHDLLREYVSLNKWKIHKIERSITASKESRRRQEEWMVVNY